VLDADDELVGFLLSTGYSANEHRVLSLATVDPKLEIGDDVHVVWGEPDGGTRKTTVEPHRQAVVSAILSPAPYSEDARLRAQRAGGRKADADSADLGCDEHAPDPSPSPEPREIERPQERRRLVVGEARA
jgi:vanillate/3-O-methylgallate O-demethylase